MNVKHTLAVMVAILVPSFAPSAEMPVPDARAGIIALDDAWIRAEVGRDRAALEAILDEQFLATLSSGKTIDRTEFISTVMNSDIKPFEVIHEEIRVHGNTVVVIDSSTDRKTRYTWVAVRKGESWKVVSEVFSKVSEAQHP